MTIWQRALPGDLYLVGVEGRLDQTVTPELEAELDQILVSGQHRIIVDMSGVNYINSGGLRCLVSAWRKAQRQGGSVVLAGLTPRVLEIVAMVGFDKVFDVYRSPGEAQHAWTEGTE